MLCHGGSVVAGFQVAGLGWRFALKASTRSVSIGLSVSRGCTLRIGLEVQRHLPTKPIKVLSPTP